MSIRYEGSTTVFYSYLPLSNGWANGKITTEDGLNQSVQIYEMHPSFNQSSTEYRKLMEMKVKSSQIPSKSLLVPLILDRYVRQDGTNVIRIFYIFDCLFEDRPICPLFPPDNNGLIDVGWGKRIIDFLNTVSAMHNVFLYHGDLSNRLKYAYSNESVRIIMPEIPCNSEDKGLANADMVALGLFLRSLVAQPSMEWTAFLDGFGKYHIDILKKHPVLKSFEVRYECLRAMLARVSSAWDSDYGDWMEFRTFLKNGDKICPNWVDQITGTGYLAAYKADNNIIFRGENVNLLLYVQNAMKHAMNPADTDLETMKRIDEDLHKMFPGLCTKVHSLLSRFSVRYPTIKAFPNFP